MTVLTFEDEASQKDRSVSGCQRIALRGTSLHVVLLAIAGVGAATVLNSAVPSLERDAVKAVRRSGGTVTFAPAKSRRVSSDSGSSGRIETLEVFNPRVVRESLWNTGVLAHPESLRTLRAPLDDGDLESLKMFRSLKTLNLYGGRITNAALEHLAVLHQLEHLTIRSREIDDAGIRPICQLPELRELILSGTGVTDAGVKQIGQIDSLTILSLAGTSLTDDGMKSIDKLKSLEELDVAKTAVTDVGLAHLHELVRLRKLNISSTVATASGLRELQDHLPMCRVVVSTPLEREFPPACSVSATGSGR